MGTHGVKHEQTGHMVPPVSGATLCGDPNIGIRAHSLREWKI